MIEIGLSISILSATLGLIIFMELMRRSGKGNIWKGLKRFFNGYE